MRFFQNMALSALAALAGCASIPLEIDHGTVVALPAAVQANAELCRQRLNDLRGSAKTDVLASDTLVVVGAALSGSGGVVGLLDSNGQHRAGAWLALGGALLAAISRIVEDPSKPLGDYGRAERHWQLAQSALINNAANTGYANQRFLDCTTFIPPPNPPVP